MLILATTSASDAIDPVWWQIAFGCFILGALVALAALVSSLLRRTSQQRRWTRRLAGVAILVSMFQVGFVAYIHHIDFVEVGGDGTPASRPLWQALLVPSLPVIASLLAMAISCTRPESARGRPRSEHEPSKP